MKNTIFIFILFTFSQIANGQIVEYKINKLSENKFDEEMQVFKGWSKWYDMDYEKIIVSEKVFKYSYIEGVGKGDGGEFVCTILNDEPNKEFTLYKKVKISVSLYNDWKKTGIGSQGFGYIYSNSNFNDILAGKNKEDIYLYYEFTNGSKGYYAFRF